MRTSNLPPQPLLLLPLALALLAAPSCVGVSAKRSAAKSGSTPAVQTCSGEVVYASEAGLIDDFEDGDGNVAKREGRGGYWWRSTDAVGSAYANDDAKPTADGCQGSSLCLHQWGKTSNAAGAWGVNFGSNVGLDGTVDVSNYIGISFRAKAGKGAGRKVRFKVGDINTHPNLGLCKSCWNHWGKDITLTGEWREYRVLFSGLQQAAGWGDPRPASVDPKQFYSIDFSIDPGQNFDIYVDDIQFLACK